MRDELRGLLSPALGATASSTTPTFAWEAYETTAGAAAPTTFSYILFAQAGGFGGFPAFGWAMPQSTTSLDLSALPTDNAAIDIVARANCEMAGGTADYGTGAFVCQGASATPSQAPLASGSDYAWGLVVIECDYSPVLSGNPAVYFACVDAFLESSQPYAIAENGAFPTP